MQALKLLLRLCDLAFDHRDARLIGVDRELVGGGVIGHEQVALLHRVALLDGDGLHESLPQDDVFDAALTDDAGELMAVAIARIGDLGDGIDVRRAAVRGAIAEKRHQKRRGKHNREDHDQPLALPGVKLRLHSRTSPSKIWMVRLARSAISCACVIITIVTPTSFRR